MKNLQRMALILIIILIPTILVLTMIRICLTPIFLDAEYRMPGFPPDNYGFTFEDRLHWAKISSAYLLDKSNSSELESQYLPNGQSLYNAREIKHMHDVKQLTQKALMLWYAGLGILVSFWIIARSGKWHKDYWLAVQHGAKLTILLIFAIILGVLLNFDEIFTAFHRIFFKGDTWLFYLSDTLIRLFPLRFWQDIFLFIGGMSLLSALLILIINKRQTK